MHKTWIFCSWQSHRIGWLHLPWIYLLYSFFCSCCCCFVRNTREGDPHRIQFNLFAIRSLFCSWIYKKSIAIVLSVLHAFQLEKKTYFIISVHSLQNMDRSFIYSLRLIVMPMESLMIGIILKLAFSLYLSLCIYSSIAGYNRKIIWCKAKIQLLYAVILHFMAKMVFLLHFFLHVLQNKCQTFVFDLIWFKTAINCYI